MVLTSKGFSQNLNFSTNGILTVDSLKFDGYIHLFSKGKYILSYDTISYDKIEAYLNNGGCLLLPNIFFSLIVNPKNELRLGYNYLKPLIIEKDKINNRCYKFTGNIILGVITSHEFESMVLDYIPLDFKNKNVLFFIGCIVK